MRRRETMPVSAIAPVGFAFTFRCDYATVSSQDGRDDAAQVSVRND